MASLFWESTPWQFYTACFPCTFPADAPVHKRDSTGLWGSQQPILKAHQVSCLAEANSSPAGTRGALRLRKPGASGAPL